MNREKKSGEPSFPRVTRRSRDPEFSSGLTGWSMGIRSFFPRRWWARAHRPESSLLVVAFARLSRERSCFVCHWLYCVAFTEREKLESSLFARVFDFDSPLDAQLLYVRRRVEKKGKLVF
ncbi:unnamed protein product [Sphagnum jensenii]|jgi:hypothetical protein